MSDKKRGILMSLENLTGFEFTCEKCACVVTTGLDRETTLTTCPNCGAAFVFDHYDDPIAHVKKAVESVKKVKGVKIRLVCEEEE